MDIACPSCAAAYELDAATVGAKGRKVRCAACGEIWRVMPGESAAPAAAEPEAASAWPPDTETVEGAATQTAPPEGEAATEPPAETAAPEPEPAPPRGARRVREAGSGSTKPAAWRGLLNWRVASVTGALLVMTVGLLEREAVVRLLPQTARLYAAVGLPVNLRGIEIRNVKSRLVVDGDEPVLVIDGDLVNVADRKVDVPRLHFALTGAYGRQVYVWSAQADRANLQPGETLNFRRRLAAPPAEAKTVSVRFVTRSDITAGIR